MPKFKYIIRLKSAHDKTGLTPYMVGKQTGVAINTVDKYASADSVEVDQLNVAIAALCDFYGVEFHEAVQVKRIDDPELKTAYTAIA